MATANTKSNIVTNADASPRVQTKASLAHARCREQRATVEIAAADDNNSVYRLFRVWSGWTISQILLWNDAITCGSDFDVGLYQTAENGGAVVDVDLWADAVSLASARTSTPLDATFELANIADIEKPLWELAGLTADSFRWYDICLTGVAVGTGAGTVSGLLRYVDGT